MKNHRIRRRVREGSCFGGVFRPHRCQSPPPCEGLDEPQRRPAYTWLETCCFTAHSLHNHRRSLSGKKKPRDENQHPDKSRGLKNSRRAHLGHLATHAAVPIPEHLRRVRQRAHELVRGNERHEGPGDGLQLFQLFFKSIKFSSFFLNYQLIQLFLQNYQIFQIF